jgi:hypothetical protein
VKSNTLSRRADRPAQSSTPPGTPANADVGVVLLVVALGMLPWAWRLGFVSDDWTFLANLANNADQTVAGLWRDHLWSHPNLLMRPTQVTTNVLLYRIFGLEALGYHLFAAAAVAVMAILLLAVLREFGASRHLAVAITAVYVVLPHYVTARLWFAAFGYLVSMAAVLGAALLLLRGVHGPPARAWRNRLGAAALVLVAGLGYEVALPLALLAGPVAWMHARRHAGGLPVLLGTAGARVYAGLDVGLVAVVLVYKAVTAEAVGLGGDARFLLVRLIVESVGINFGVLGAGLPDAAWWGLRSTPVLAVVGIAVAAGVLGWHLYRLVAAEPLASRSWRWWLTVAGAGLVVFAAGYAVFLGTARVLFTALGIGNRTTTAAALGVAICAVALCGLIADRVSRQLVAGVPDVLIDGGAASSDDQTMA